MELRYILSSELSLILTLIGLVIAFVGVLVNRKVLAKIGVLVFCVSLLLLLNYIDMSKYVRVPDVVEMDYYSAQRVLENHYLRGYPTGAENRSISQDDIVVRQQPAANSVVLVNSRVELTIIPASYFSPDDHNESEGNEVESEDEGKSFWITEPDGNSRLSDIDITENSSGQVYQDDNERSSVSELQININNYQRYYNGFYFEYPMNADGSTTVIDFPGEGISGTFSYTRPLSKSEEQDWGHGGKLLGPDGNELIDAQKWSDKNGMFACGFPAEMQSGQYVYVFYQIIDDQYCEAQIMFTYP